MITTHHPRLRTGLWSLFLSALLAPSSLLAGLGDLHSVWQFENNVSESNGGSALVPTGFFPIYSSESIAGASANTINIPALPASQWLQMPNGIGANGGSSQGLTNNWTVVMDVKFSALSTDVGLLQTDAANGDDAEVHVMGGPGLQYEYYETAPLSKLPDFDLLTPVTTGTISNFDLSPRQQNSYFAFRYRGRIRIPAGGTYTFYTKSDDGSHLRINGSLVVNNDGLHSAQTRSGTIVLTEGTHDLEVTFFEQTGAEVLTVEYEGPGIARQLIPSSVLTQGDAGALRLGATKISDPASIQLEKWHRLALTCETTGGITTVRAYIDGVPTTLGGYSTPLITTVDSNYALPAAVKLFTDDNDQTEAVKVNSLALFGQALSDVEIAALGVAHFPGCPDLVVLNTNNDGPGSLRGAIDNVRSGGIITFDFSLSGQTIWLGSDGDLDIAGRYVIIDAMHLPVKPLIDGGDNFRVFNIQTGSNITLRGLRMERGSAPLGEEGGAVRNQAIVTIEQCEIRNSSADFGGGVSNESGGTMVIIDSTISGNSAAVGGALSNAGTATIHRCTISGNSAGVSGGIEDINSTTLINCTIANNSATDGGGGGITTFGNLVLRSCTVSGNDAFDPFEIEGGGGVLIDALANATMENCIVAGNTSNVQGEENVGGFGVPTYLGGTVASGDPMLEDLGDFGGITETMPPKDGSPAAAAGTPTENTTASDQRGLPRIDGLMDVGAVETALVGTNSLFVNWAFTNVSNPAKRAPTDDPEGDRVNNFLEYAFRMDPDVFDSRSQPLAYNDPPNIIHANLQILIPIRVSATDVIYIIEETSDLETWSEIYRYNVLTGTETITDPTLITTVNIGYQTITVTEPNANFNPVTTFWRVAVQTNP